MEQEEKTFRILSIEGGGMRGIYACEYLLSLAKVFNNSRDCAYDIGKCFDLIVGTSTGGIIASALFAGIDLKKIRDLYLNEGKDIFPQKFSEKFHEILIDSFFRKDHIKKGSQALKQKLIKIFNDKTIEDVYRERNIRLCIPSTNVSRVGAKNFIFKTDHNNSSNGRDNKNLLSDVCLATSAAPMYLSIACINETNFVDGGIWANNPVLISILEALDSQPNITKMEVYSLGTLNQSSLIDVDSTKDLNYGLLEWRCGKSIISLLMDAQHTNADQQAKILARALKKLVDIKIIKFRNPSGQNLPKDLFDLDVTEKKHLEQLRRLANETATKICSDSRNDDLEALCIKNIFSNIPLINEEEELTNV
jgi:uncharacterized protein